MRDGGAETLTTAYEQGWALGAFSTYTREITQAICRTAQDAARPVIIQAGAVRPTDRVDATGIGPDKVMQMLG
jgi:fructose/tagatose bisphosphate aldolase